MASSAPARASREWMLWRPVSRRLTAVALAPALLVLALFQLATSEGGQHLESLTWVETAMLLALAWVTWVRAVPRLPVVRPLVFMIAAIGLTTVSSVRMESSLHELLLWLMYLSIFVVTASTLTGADQVRKFVDAAVVIGGWLCLIALFFFWGTNNPNMRWYSTFYWPNPFAGFLLLLLPVVLTRFLHARGPRESLAHGGITLLLSVALILTYSRGAWVSLGMITPIALLVLRPSSWAVAIRRSVLIVALVVLSVVLLTKGIALRKSHEGVVGRVASISALEDTSIQGRLNFWQAGLRIFLDYPIVGTGPGTFGTVHPAYQRDVRFYAKDPHNLYIQTAAEMGIVGGTALVILMVSIAMLWRRALVVTTETRAYPIAAGLGLGLAAYAVHSALEMDWSFPANPAMAFALVGVLTAYDRAIQRPGRRPRPPQPARWRQLIVGGLLGVVIIVQVFQVAQRQFAEGQNLARIGSWRAAADRYALAVRLNPFVAKYLAHYADAVTRLPEARFDVATASVRRATILDRMNAAYPVQLSKLLIARGVNVSPGGDAEALLLQALHLDGHNRPETYRVLAQLYRQQGRYEDADRVYRDAFALYRGHNLGRGSIIYARLWPEVMTLYLDAAEMFVDRVNLPQAAQVLREFLTEDPSAVPAAMRLSTIYIQMGRPAEARALLKATADRVPDNAQIRAALEALR